MRFSGFIQMRALLAFALWAGLEFRAADSICGSESGIDPDHTCVYNPLPADLKNQG